MQNEQLVLTREMLLSYRAYVRWCQILKLKQDENEELDRWLEIQARLADPQEANKHA